MTQRATRPLLVLVDANIIIELHRLGIWAHILERCQVYTTSSIAGNEAKYFKRRRSERIEISLQANIAGGSLSILEASLEDLVKLEDIFEAGFLQTLHDGEREALALIAADKHEGCSFCTSDGPAIKALAMMRKEAYGMSLESLLKEKGFSSKIDSISPWCTKETYNLRIRDGFLNVVTREGLVDKSVG